MHSKLLFNTGNLLHMDFPFCLDFGSSMYSKQNISDELLQRIFPYLKGANLNNTKLDMTAPVVTQISPKYGFRESHRNYTVACALRQIAPSRYTRY